MRTRLSFEEVAPDARLFLALVRGHPRLPRVASRPDPAAVAARVEGHRAALVSALRRRNESLGAPPEALATLARLGEPGTVAVVAGQQPVLLGGPHLVLTKAVAAVVEARRLEASGVPAVPLFWTADEDSDHAEADHVGMLVSGGGQERLRYPLPGDGRMLASVPVEPDRAADLLARLGELLPPAEGRGAALALAAPAAGDSYGDWFSRILLRLVGPLGVAVVHPADVRPFAREVISHELRHPGVLAEEILSEQRRAAEETGSPPPLTLLRGQLFFVVRSGVRRKVHYDEGNFVVEGEGALGAGELERRLAAEPGAFAWNVASRVLAQNVALPVAAQLCGPAELAYCGVLSGVHRVLGIAPPAFLARPGATWVEEKVAQACASLGVDPADVVVRGELAFPPPPDAEEPVELAAARAAAEGLPEDASQALRRRREAILRAVELYAEAHAREAAARADVGAARRLRILGALRPRGGLQERELGVLPWIAKYGLDLPARLLDALSAPGTEHVLLRPGAG